MIFEEKQPAGIVARNVCNLIGLLHKDSIFGGLEAVLQRNKVHNNQAINCIGGDIQDTVFDVDTFTTREILIDVLGRFGNVCGPSGKSTGSQEQVVKCADWSVHQQL
jgi:hypothetical protein